MKTEELIELCANGNKEAAIFMATFHRFCHAVDDIVDAPGLMNAEDVVTAMLGMIVNVSSNPFYQANRARFEALFDSAAAAWLDSNAVKAGGPSAEGVRAVLKGHYHEVFYQCARLTGGWAHMRKITAAHREYHVEPERPGLAADYAVPIRATQEVNNGVL